MEKSKIQPRQLEVIRFTDNSADMINMYIAEPVVKKCKQNFLDEDTGESIDIEMGELLFHKGTFITASMLSEINFSILAKEITGLTVSNQRRSGYEAESAKLGVYVAQIFSDQKNRKYLLYANNIANALDIIRDYAEQIYDCEFEIVMVKEFTDSIILEDNLRNIDIASEDEEAQLEEMADRFNFKFFQIDTSIAFEDSPSTSYHFIVRTSKVEKAMVLISKYINAKDKERSEVARKSGNYSPAREFTIELEKVAPMPIVDFVPKVFTDIYCKQTD